MLIKLLSSHRNAIYFLSYYCILPLMLALENFFTSVFFGLFYYVESNVDIKALKSIKYSHGKVLFG